MEEIFAPPPVITHALTSDVEVLEWLPETSAARSVVLVPGWGAHPRYYGNLIAELLRARMRVASAWPAEKSDVTPYAHFQRIPQLFDHVRAESPEPGLGVVAESLGAAYLLSSGVLRPADRALLISPGVFVRRRHILSVRALFDAISLLTRNRIGLTGWRLESVSRNLAFLEAVRESDLSPGRSDLGYVWHALVAATKALAAPTAAGDMWIVHSREDRLASPLGAKLLAKRLGGRCRFTLLPDGDHGLTWDHERGGELVRQAAEYLAGS